MPTKASPSRRPEVTPESKTSHDWFFELPLTHVRPATVNEQLYRPVVDTDPEVQALAESIGNPEIGQLEPIVITTDNIIISGHRRHCACRLAGLKRIRCRRHPIHSSDPQFLILLRECNRQREKSFDEVLRERLLDVNPEEAFEALIEQRELASRISADPIKIVGRKHRAKISPAKQPMLNAILRIIEDRRNYWPLTDRQVHYALLNNPPLRHASKPGSTYVNNDKSYGDLTDLITRARLVGDIPFLAIDDPTRPMTTWDVFRTPGEFVANRTNDFLKGYWRDLQQSQPNHIEIIGEKNTIGGIVEPVAKQFTIPLTIGRGYCSLPPRYEMAQRFRKSGKQKLVILALSDFDPEGEDIAHSFARSMRDDFAIENIHAIKVALTAEQVQEMKLPPWMKAKKGSSRRKGFVSKFGDYVFELEAVSPDRLQQILTDAIDGALDRKTFNHELEKEKQDAAHLEQVRRAAIKAMRN
jgi:hypothetical protein